MKKAIFAIAIVSAVALAVPAFAKSASHIALSERKQSIVIVSALAAKGDWNKLKGEVDLALERGLTVNDIGELFLQLYAYAGFPKSLNAQNVLKVVVEEREAAGKNVIYGTTPDAVPIENRYIIGRDTINKMFGRNATQDRPTTTGYAETTDIFLKEHLFSDITNRNNMNAEERELSTASMLAALMTVNPQFTSHTNGAMMNGNTEEEMRAAYTLIGQKVGKAEGKNALSILDTVLKNNAVFAQKTNAAAATNVVAANTAENREDVFPPQAKVSAFPVGEVNERNAQYFSGKSFLAPLVSAEEGVSIANVTFEPGCRNNWHIHKAKSGGGQILMCVGGRGWYQIEGKAAQALKAGDVAVIPPNTKHWHGAAKDSWFSHIAVAVPGTETGVQWLEEVSDVEYNGLR